LLIKSLFKHTNSIKYSELNTEGGQKYILINVLQVIDVLGVGEGGNPWRMMRRR